MKIKYASVLVFAVSLFAAAVQAQQVVSYYAEIPNVTLCRPQVLELPKFDSQLGDLTEVKLNFTGEIWQSIYGENKNATAAAYDFSSTARLKLVNDTGLTLFLSPSFNLKRKGTVAAYDGRVDFTGGSGLRFEQDTTIGGVYIDPELGQYIGTGKIDFQALLEKTTLLNSDANFAKGSSVASTVGLSVDYTYSPLTAIPEPSTCAALMGALVASMAVVLKRRQALTV